MLEMDLSHRRLDFSIHVSKVTGKDGSRYKSGFDRTEFPLDSIAELITRFCWSPIIWKGGVRDSNNFWLSQLVALDFDSPEYTLKQALNDWCDTVHIIGTTFSHQKDKDGVTCDRFRIVSVWSEPITNPELYKPSLKELMKQNRAQHADKKCIDLARFFFPCTEIVNINTEGYVIEPETLVPPLMPYKVTPAQGLPSRALKYLMKKIPPGERNWASYKFAWDCARAGKNPDEVIAWVRKSKTYIDEKDQKVLGYEIPATVRSAFKKCMEAMRRG